ncbi:MAG: hypothetical protein DMF87_24655 [Acidobacteria bacterium]|nr:MAG: hypothetical protein DMF87_24655 [Acidobacteriota bacterium]
MRRKSARIRVSVNALALDPGTWLGPYEIVSPIGAGAMGEVYRARDRRLKRDVAIKVLPESLSSAPDRLARFRREAELLAALNHPHIAALYSLEESAVGDALVMELVDGETLADRIARGRIPLDEALALAREISEALQAAHDQGVIHRDLKPANIKITSAGAVKVLDFGIAKFADPAVTPSFMSSAAPTREESRVLLTEIGAVLGTPAYMSPEQTQGGPAARSSDVWAFGCVLYEMLAGERAFGGTHVFEVFAAVAHLDPDWAVLPASLPRPIRALLESCLVKDPRRRIRDMSTVLFLLDNCENLAEPVPRVPETPRTPWWRRIALIAAATTVIIAFAGVALWFGTSSAPSTQAGVRFQIRAPGDGPAEMLTLSPDGRHLAFVAPNGGANQIWIRPMSALESRPLAGTNGATYPFWSPDGVSLGYFAQGKLKKIAIEGGLPQTVCEAPSGRGGTWNRNGVILFSAGPRNPIVRVAAAGGTPTPVTRLERESAGHRFPAFLPDGIHFLYSVGDDNPETSGLYLGALDGTSRVRLLPDETNALYAPPLEGSAIGHLIFRRDGTLMAQPFDPHTLTLSGEMSPIAEGVPQTEHDGFGAFSISSNGTLVYRAGGTLSNRTLQWTDRAGKRVATLGQAAAFASSPVISPDQRSVAVTITNGSQSDIWLHDVRRNLFSRFTFRPGHHRSPIWTADSTRLAFAFQDPYSANIYIRTATGEGAEELLLRGGVNAYPMDWSSDGRWMLYEQQGETTGLDLWLLPLEGDRKPIPYLQTRAHETQARFRPNASGGPRWMAYSSDESGRPQIYVDSIPPGAKYQISTEGGTLPRWRGDGKELFYLAPDGKLMAVGIAPGTSVTPATPSELFADPSISGYDASADGQRFLVVAPADANAALPPPVTVVLGWKSELN